MSESERYFVDLCIERRLNWNLRIYRIILRKIVFVRWIEFICLIWVCLLLGMVIKEGLEISVYEWNKFKCGVMWLEVLLLMI